MNLDVVTPAETNALTVQETAIRELDLDEDDTDGLEELIHAASADCASYCNRPKIQGYPGTFGRATVRETIYLECASNCIVLDDWLNPAITSITFDGTALTSTEYELDGARLYRLSDTWRTFWSPGLIVVTYQTGFNLLRGDTDTLQHSLPQEIEQACLIILAHRLAQRGADPMVRSESVAGVASATYLDPSAGAEDIPPQAARRLDRYRQVYL